MRVFMKLTLSIYYVEEISSDVSALVPHAFSTDR